MPYSEKICEFINDTTLQFFVLELDGRQFEYHLLKEAKGIQLLNIILHKHQITESTYFGLKYTNSKNVTRWINIRNPLVLEVDNPCLPIKLEFAVKYYVPYNLLNDFPIKSAFLSQIKNDIQNGRFTLSDETDDILRFLALLAQAEHGAYFKQLSYTTPPHFSLERDLIEEHKLIESISKMEALDEVLRIASSLSNYGNHEYTVKNGCFSISPTTFQYSFRNVTKTFPLYLIIDVTRVYGSVLLSLSNFEQSETKIKIKPNSISEAKILHKNILELMTFFTRPCVTEVIADATHRLWKGAKFITIHTYDVTQTCSQLNPSLYSVKHLETDPTTHSIESRILERKSNSEEFKLYKVCSLPEIGRIVKRKLSFTSLRLKRQAGTCQNSDSISSHSLLSSESIDDVFKIADKMLKCKLCDTKDCKVLFLPCCHFISCEGCSDNRKSCLECNSHIIERVKVYIS
ncbi:E3 ubiquitin-protein ligase MYLIP isoform X2 [Oopsacas minuta]|uniref:E3 ubiquitin-protein ligase MYLIP isoform X2 n=1 Tax=Oopsacas minuta TaxID=111878 RepID=A0AAV7JYN5_9METZ|nr:E3 ubiquitin-protein ligase MYLIP isoform X2 [Oopsacas minuta]